MINYYRLGYEIKREFTNFFDISKDLKAPMMHRRIFQVYESSKPACNAFIFYALWHAPEPILSMGRSGISGFLPSKIKSQQIKPV